MKEQIDPIKHKDGEIIGKLIYDFGKESIDARPYDGMGGILHQINIGEDYIRKAYKLGRAEGIDKTADEYEGIEEILTFISQKINLAVAEEAELGYQQRKNEMKFIGHLQHRCPECGKETQTTVTWLEAMNSNALWGICFECSSKKPASSN